MLLSKQVFIGKLALWHCYQAARHIKRSERPLNQLNFKHWFDGRELSNAVWDLIMVMPSSMVQDVHASIDRSA